jgi:geranylgeranyl reductase family protein|tara:strand:- start:88297 stop:89448 length:1152 start_codon:yes stop_codon:yes gene_type:complete
LGFHKIYDVAVVGSGPAGAMAAFCLAKKGVRVAILEKSTLPRYKPCGGGIVRKAMQLLPVDVAEIIERECYRVELNYIPHHLHFSAKRKRPIVSMTMRDKFDYRLVLATRAAGADIFSKCRVVDVVSKVDMVDLMTSKGPFRARFVVGADGSLSAVAKKSGWRETRNLIPAIESEMLVSQEEMDRFCHSARFDFGLFSGGYGWVFPKKAHLSVGVLSMRKNTVRLNDMMGNYLKALEIDPSKKSKRYGYLIPVTPRNDAFMKGRVLLTGDAAGFANPITGEGISFALLSGQTAAYALLDGAFRKSGVKNIFESEIKKKILPELHSVHIFAKLVYRYPRLFRLLLRFHGQKFVENVTDIEMGKTTYRCLATDPLNYLQLFRLWD